MGFTIGMLFFGNLIDNVVNPKYMLIICEMYVSFSYINMYLIETPAVS